jgi:hypothetical protein
MLDTGPDPGQEVNLGNHPCNCPASAVGCSDGQPLAHPSHEARKNMDRETITKDQAKTINASVQSSLGFLFRLRERMDDAMTFHLHIGLRNEQRLP